MKNLTPPPHWDGETSLISVIVPVYNAEKFIDRCVNSVLQQTYPHWELLLVDDGSPDNSPAMCDAWKEKNDRIRVFHKANGGVSSARNVGLENIKGEWLMFVDSDDCIEPTCLEESLQHVLSNGLDVVQFRMKRVLLDGSTKFYEEEDSPVCDTETYLKEAYLSGCVWGGLYRSRIVTNNHIRFAEHLHYLEDAFFVCEILKNSQWNQRIDKHFYLYYYNPNGSDKPKDWDYYLDSIEYAAVYKQENPLFANLIDGWCTMLAMRYVTLAGKLDYNRFSKAWKELSVSRDYLRNAHRKDVVFFNAVYGMLGIRSACILTKAMSRLYHMRLSNRKYKKKQ